MFHPSKAEFLDLTKKGNLIPVRLEVLADTETPLTAYQKLTLGKPRHSFILESVEGGEHLGRYSIIGFDPKAILSVKNGTLTIERNGESTTQPAPKDPLTVVEAEMKKYKSVQVEGFPRFTGGMVGYLGCEYLSCIEPVPYPKQDELKIPMMYYMLLDTLVIFDRVRQVIQIITNVHVESDAASAYAQACQKLLEIQKQLREPLTFHSPSIPATGIPDLEFKSNMAKTEYLDMVIQGKKLIKQGDIFQFVPSQRFSSKTNASPIHIYRALRTINPSPYMFLMQLEGFSLIGSSPEIHVRCEEGHVEIRPIAGTRKRGITPEEDSALEKELLANEKERAEHLMLVDLARNDIGRVCDYKTVTVPQFMIIEKYSHVMHIVSEVTGKLNHDKTAFDLMRATFPAGTLSGAPKIRAMQIISDLEKRCRGTYGGALGYFSFNGNVDTCITIRTLVLKDGVAHVQAGGGVVDDSDPEEEYQETVNKSKGMVKAVSLAEQFAAHEKNK